MVFFLKKSCKKLNNYYIFSFFSGTIIVRFSDDQESPMNQYLVAIHYIQLLQAELDILNHDARLLFDLKIEPNLAKRELADLKVSLSKLSDKNLYIEGTIWYQPSLFAIIDQNLGVIDDWLKELDDFFEFTYSTTVFTVLKENENRSYDLLLGLYSRLEYVISEIKNCR